MENRCEVVIKGNQLMLKEGRRTVGVVVIVGNLYGSGPRASKILGTHYSDLTNMVEYASVEDAVLAIRKLDADDINNCPECEGNGGCWAHPAA